MQKSRSTPASLIITLTITESAPTVRLSILEGTVVGLARVGYSAAETRDLLRISPPRFRSIVRRLCKRLKLETLDELWTIVGEQTSFID